MTIINTARAGAASALTAFGGAAAVPTIVATSQMMTAEQAQAAIIDINLSGTISNSSNFLNSFGLSEGESWNLTGTIDTDDIPNVSPFTNLITYEEVFDNVVFNIGDTTIFGNDFDLTFQNADFSDPFNLNDSDFISFNFDASNIVSSVNDPGIVGGRWTYFGDDGYIDGVGVDQLGNLLNFDTEDSLFRALSSEIAEMQTNIPAPGVLALIGMGGIVAGSRKFGAPTREI